MNKVCIYLRKSRADEELEKTLGAGETLSKHRKALLKFAKEKDLNIVEIKEEIVSGDSLFFRPKMLELLQEIENKTYTGVLVMDIDRLGRGGMKDQGIILEAFKQSNTKIITPTKTYDLDDELDEELTEFKAFFSRRELKTINRRMQSGRVRSVQDGNYIATNPPLGYDIAMVGKSRTLKINPDEEIIIKTIFKMYIEGSGARVIAEHLNNCGYKTKFGNSFDPTGVLFILKNPIYMGKVTWKKRDITKSKTPGKVKDTRTRDEEEWIVSDGKHEPIIDKDTFDKVCQILSLKYHIPYQIKNGPANPLAGIVRCKKCGSKMILRKYRNNEPFLLCKVKGCCKSSKFALVEDAILKVLDKYLKEYEITRKTKTKDTDILAVNTVEVLTKELTTLEKQRLKLFDLLEQGLYDNATFLERSNNLNDRIVKITKEKDRISKKLNSNKENKVDEELLTDFIEIYKSTTDITKKNALLKGILFKVDYEKDKGNKFDDFKIQLYPRF